MKNLKDKFNAAKDKFYLTYYVDPNEKGAGVIFKHFKRGIATATPIDLAVAGLVIGGSVIVGAPVAAVVAPAVMAGALIGGFSAPIIGGYFDKKALALKDKAAQQQTPPVVLPPANDQPKL